ncbi:hypothetical protein [Flavobacterium sp.]|uniref:hypothetical protein n=1 Tax=Flavobacterium sp. TaxID=239 RepID=UPI0026066198|nr:hypothetical protein [Flavobacterium sp.]MDD2986122.1 hypothetical protein [Flavobacterium sp.]
MKTILRKGISQNVQLICGFICLLLVSSCDLFESDAKKKHPQLKKCLVIIKDESASISQTETDNQKQRLWLKKYLHQHYEPQEDILVLFINASSSSAVNHKELLWKKSKEQQADEYLSETDQMLKQSQKEMDNNLQFKRNQKQLLELLFDNKTKVPSHQTQIIELMPQLERITKGYDKVELLLITDAFQESPIRDFSKNMPASKAQAEQFAREDFLKISKQFSVNPNLLMNFELIQVLVPPKTNPQTLVNIPYYFDEFFAKFGYSQSVNWASL